MANNKKPVGKAESQIEAKKAKHPGGRPTNYTYELGERICKEISCSEMGLNKLHDLYDWFPDRQTILEWLTKHPEFNAQYSRGKEMQAELMRENILIIADDSSGDTIETSKGIIENREFTSRSKLRVETRMWLMARLAPKKYGNQIEPEQSDKELAPPPTIHVHISPDVVKKAEGL